MDLTSFMQGLGDGENEPAASTSLKDARESQFGGKTIADIPNTSFNASGSSS